MMLLFAFVEIPVLLILLACKKIAEAVASTRQKHAAKATSKSREKAMELSDKQRVKIVTAILEDSLLINDTAYDNLMQDGECLYNAAEAAKTNSQDFELQYGSKDWLRAWTVALERWFDCEAEYTEVGMFHVFGKEA